MSKKEGSVGRKESKSESPSSLIQAIITESESLLKLLVNYFEKEGEDEQDIILLGGILRSPVQK